MRRRIRRLRKAVIVLMMISAALGGTGYYLDKDATIATVSKAKRKVTQTTDTVVTAVSNADVKDIVNTVKDNFTSNETPQLETEQPAVTEAGTELLPVKVKRVVDGDTFVALSDGEEYKIRLIGIDTPESVAPEEYLEKSGKQNTEEGKDASAYTKSLIDGQTVYLDFDVQKEDKYGRVLAYVYLEDGQMLQDILLQNGYAQLMTVMPNAKYADHFAEVVRTAREEEKHRTQRPVFSFAQKRSF